MEAAVGVQQRRSLSLQQSRQQVLRQQGRQASPPSAAPAARVARSSASSGGRPTSLLTDPGDRRLRAVTNRRPPWQHPSLAKRTRNGAAPRNAPRKSAFRSGQATASSRRSIWRRDRSRDRPACRPAPAPRRRHRAVDRRQQRTFAPARQRLEFQIGRVAGSICTSRSVSARAASAGPSRVCVRSTI